MMLKQLLIFQLAYFYLGVFENEKHFGIFLS